jgi:hypothetical protein
MKRITRRGFLRRVGLAGAGVAILPGRSGAQKTVGLVKRVVYAPGNTYFTYPHCNGFLPDGAAVLAQYAKGVNPHVQQPLDYLAFDMETGAVRTVGHCADARTYYCVAKDGVMLAPTTRGAHVMDLAKGGAMRTIYTVGADWKVGDVSDISADGREAMLNSFKYSGPGVVAESRIEGVDVASGKVRRVMDTNWLMNHVHYSPYDPAWVMFCHEGKADDRIWTWNAKEAPKGRMLFDQKTADGKFFNVGHERAMFHKKATLFVAYRNSSARPIGLYEVTFDRAAKVVSVYDRYWHCNISRDGRWAVADTIGPVDGTVPKEIPGLGNDGLCHVLAVNLRTGAREILSSAHAGPMHPYHPHPHISPDGRWVVFNDAVRKGVVAVEIDQGRLEEFLEKG